MDPNLPLPALAPCCNARHGHHKDAHKTPASLVLEDGTRFEGFSFGAKKSVAGEVSRPLPASHPPHTHTISRYHCTSLVATKGVRIYAAVMDLPGPPGTPPTK